MNPQHGGGSGDQPPPAFDNMSDGGISDDSLPDYLRPSDQYIAPACGLAFGQLGGEQSSLLQFLPYRNAADRLMEQYFTAVHVVAPCSHRPSLESAYASFWEEIQAGFEPRPSTQTVIFAALFSAIVSMDEHVVVSELGGYVKNTWVGGPLNPRRSRTTPSPIQSACLLICTAPKRRATDFHHIDSYRV